RHSVHRHEGRARARERWSRRSSRRRGGVRWLSRRTGCSRRRGAPTMSHAVVRVLRIPAVVFAVWLVLAYVVPLAMTRYAPFTLRPGLGCVPQGGGQIVIISGVPTVVQAATCQTLAELYRRPFTELFVD